MKRVYSPISPTNYITFWLLQASLTNLPGSQDVPLARFAVSNKLNRYLVFLSNFIFRNSTLKEDSILFSLFQPFMFMIQMTLQSNDLRRESNAHFFCTSHFEKSQSESLLIDNYTLQTRLLCIVLNIEVTLSNKKLNHVGFKKRYHSKSLACCE